MKAKFSTLSTFIIIIKEVKMEEKAPLLMRAKIRLHDAIGTQESEWRDNNHPAHW